MRLIFAGTPEFARVALVALAAAGHDVCAVLTQPDRPAGRGMKLTASPVKEEALRRGLPVLQPSTLKDADIQARIAAFDAEVMVVAAYGMLLPQAVLDLPRRGCLNIHASLLPRWRGAAPIQRALLAGDAETGVTIMQMDAGLDTGAMRLKAATPILASDTAARLHDRLAALGGEAICAVLADPDRYPGVAQDDGQACYAAKISKAEARVDWRLPVAAIDRQVRAWNPFPGAQGVLGGEIWKIWAAHPAPGDGAPGTLLAVAADGLLVACGDGALRVTELQRPGGKRLAVAQCHAALKGFVGQRFDA